MHDGHEEAHRNWRIPDALWERIEPLLPPHKPHPLRCHRPRVDARKAMDGIFFGLRTGCQWNVVHETGICSSSFAHRRFQERTEAGLFLALWKSVLLPSKALQGLDMEGMCLEKNYDYDKIRELLDGFGSTAHVRAREEKAKALQQKTGFKSRR